MNEEWRYKCRSLLMRRKSVVRNRILILTHTASALGLLLVIPALVTTEETQTFNLDWTGRFRWLIQARKPICP